MDPTWTLISQEGPERRADGGPSFVSGRCTWQFKYRVDLGAIAKLDRTSQQVEIGQVLYAVVHTTQYEPSPVVFVDSNGRVTWVALEPYKPADFLNIAQPDLYSLLYRARLES
jgi:hypothetical protein